MIALIILAAGESSRLGRPKQNLLFNGQTLLQLAVQTGKKSACSKIIVVLGANAEEVGPLPGTITLYNQNWKDGMASSIRTAMLEVNDYANIDKVIIMLCDQPFVSAKLLNTLIDKQTESGKPIVACAYNNTTGVPVLFERSFFTELLLLQGQEGAKTILKNYSSDIETVLFERGHVDIDTIEDYERLTGTHKSL